MLAKSAFICVLLALLIAFSTAATPLSALSSRPHNAAAYVLAMERPAPNKQLTLHGLWPQGSQSCTTEAFDIKQLEPIMPEMEANWYSYKDKSKSDVFWAHEWSKHGTCWAKAHQSNQLGYFSTTLDLLGKIGHFYCNKPQFCDCRCNLDENYKLIGECAQKGDKPPI